MTRTIYDARGLALSQWEGVAIGTDYDAANNRVKTAEFTYDDDGNALTDTQYADGSHSYTTTNAYDFRDRLVATRGPDGVATRYVYNNLDEETEADTFIDADADLVMDPGEQTGEATTAYDDQGRVYSTTTYQGSRKLDAGALTSSGTTATVTLVGHGFTVGQHVTIAGADQAAYDDLFTVSAVTADTFTFTLASAASAAVATGTRITVTADKRLTTGYWYDKRGNLIKSQSPSGLIQKTFYDGAGRVVRDATSADPTEAASPTYANAQTLTGDQVIEQNDYWLDKGGRTRITTNWKRDGSESSSVTGEATADDFDHTAAAYWYDAADRAVAMADYGRDGGEAGASSSDRLVWNGTGHTYKDADADGLPDVIDAAQDASPGRDNASSQTSYDWIYTGYGYDAAGNLYSTTDNAGRQTRYAYDLAGRKTAMVENYVDGTASEGETDTDRTTQYGYDAFGRMTTQTALNPLGTGLGVQSQVTTFAYGSDVDRSWPTATIYGDSSATVSIDGSGKGTVSSSDAVKTTYDRLGRKATETDQRGYIHTYHYDGTTGLLLGDSINGTTPGDGSTASIVYAYDDQSRLATVTCMDANGTTVLNQVGFTYDAWGNVIRDAQAHDGSVTASTPSTQYRYEDGSGTAATAKYVRLAETLYPTTNGTTAGAFVTDYGTDDVDTALVRTTGTSDAASHAIVRYAYLGLGQIIKTSRPSIAVGLNLTAGTKADHYSGLDRYGRWHEMVWTNDLDNRRTEDRIYTYDRMGNRLSMDQQLGGQDDTYAYDGLDRLSAWDHGIIISGSIPGYADYDKQRWTLDALGNWRTQTEDYDGAAGAATNQTIASRTVNGANEITQESGTALYSGYPVFTPRYDAAGNVYFSGQSGNMSAQMYYAYDGWNRLRASSISGAVTQGLDYDGLGRLIRKINVDTASNGTSEDYFYNESDQVIELHSGTVTSNVTTMNAAVRERDLWDASYVNSPALTELDNNADGTIDRKLYPVWDANYEVTALVAPHGRAVERYVWHPYGEPPVAYNGLASYDGAAEVLNGGESYTGSADEGGDWSFD